jgi:hypothetical protein
MTDRKFKMFEKVEIPEGLKTVLDEQIRTSEALEAQVHELAMAKKTLREDIWKGIHEVFPELEEYVCTLTNKGGEVALYPKYRRGSEGDLKKRLREAQKLLGED